MPELSHKKLFPHIHPLLKPDAQIIDMLANWNDDLCTHYGSHLPNEYLNEKKLELAIEYLNKLSKKTNTAINKLIKAHNTCNLCNTPKLVLEYGDISIFWLFQTAAFILLNQYIAKQEPAIAFLIEKCFRNALNYKLGWIERAGRRDGARGRDTKYRGIEQEMFMAWCTYPLDRKKDTHRSAFWLMKSHNPHGLKESTIKKYIREWKKNL